MLSENLWVTNLSRASIGINSRYYSFVMEETWHSTMVVPGHDFLLRGMPWLYVLIHQAPKVMVSLRDSQTTKLHIPGFSDHSDFLLFWARTSWEEKSRFVSISTGSGNKLQHEVYGLGPQRTKNGPENSAWEVYMSCMPIPVLILTFCYFWGTYCLFITLFLLTFFKNYIILE